MSPNEIVCAGIGLVLMLIGAIMAFPRNRPACIAAGYSFLGFGLLLFALPHIASEGAPKNKKQAPSSSAQKETEKRNEKTILEQVESPKKGAGYYGQQGLGFDTSIPTTQQRISRQINPNLDSAFLSAWAGDLEEAASIRESHKRYQESMKEQQREFEKHIAKQREKRKSEAANVDK